MRLQLGTTGTMASCEDPAQRAWHGLGLRVGVGLFLETPGVGSGPWEGLGGQCLAFRESCLVTHSSWGLGEGGWLLREASFPYVLLQMLSLQGCHHAAVNRNAAELI